MMRRGFTLIELMVSIALALVLIAGVSQVFRIASTSIGAGNALSDTARDNRAIQTVINNDFQNALIRSGDMPCFIIKSSRTSAFLDQREELGDRDYASVAGTTAAAIDKAIRTADMDGDNKETPAPGTAATVDEVSRNNLSRRNFRQDVMCFFARYRYPRQTGNDGTYVADMGSNEAFVWYGHVRQPKDAMSSAANNPNPGWEGGTNLTAQTNPNNFYARQWGLGRVAMLLKGPDAAGRITDRAGTTFQHYIGRVNNNVSDNYTPLGQDSGATDGVTAEPGALLQYSRYDLAGTTIDAYKTILTSNVFPNYWALVAGKSVWYGPGGLTQRFTGYPYPTKPISSYGAARTVPWLVGGCTNFIVEYAGDFLTQDANTGAVGGNYATGPTDNTIDFLIDATGNRRVRWYGYPRDVAGITVTTATGPDGKITQQGSPGLPVSGSPDVLPLRDFITGTAALITSRPGEQQGAAFEHLSGTMPAANYNNTNSPASGTYYACAWQPPGTYRDQTGAVVADPPKPSMIRVTMTVDDQNGRLPEGQTYEYVINLP